MWNKAGFVGRGQSFCTKTPPPVWFSPLPADPLHLRGCGGEQSCGSFVSLLGSTAAAWKEEREIRGGSTGGRGRVWTGGREQVIKQLLEAGAEAGVLLWWAAVPDRTCPVPRVGHLPFESSGCWSVCVCACVCVCWALKPVPAMLGLFTDSCGILCCPVICNIYFIIYINSCSCCLQGIPLSKHWARLPSFKSVSTNTFDVVFLLLGSLYYFTLARSFVKKLINLSLQVHWLSVEHFFHSWGRFHNQLAY